MKSRINLKTLFTLVVFVVAFNSFKAHAQEGFASVTDSLGSELEQVKADVSKLKKLKISGYIQVQSQFADSIPGKFAGGDFKDANGGTLSTRFKVRRGRIKFAYDTELFQYGLQFQIDETGTLATKEIYGVFTEPFLKAFSLTGGVFNRPFGYEIDYSSSLRESPEFSRVTQTLFPNEQDMGFMFTFNPAKGTPYDFIKVQAGWFNGNGMNADNHTAKDFIGRAGFAKTVSNENIKIGGGFSYYKGGTFVGSIDSKNVYGTIMTAGSGGYTASTSTDNRGSYAKREYFGLDAQFSAVHPFGPTSLRAEYIWGTQSSTDQTYGISPTANASGPVFQRQFAGYYVYFVQNILNSKHSFVVKYDVYDPNTNVAGTDIKPLKVGLVDGANNKIMDVTTTTAVDPTTGVNTTTTSSTQLKAATYTAADVMYSTLGIGYIFNVNPNFKFTAYYDMPQNEKTSIAPTTTSGVITNTGYLNVQKGNILTLRIQYKF